MDQRLVVFSNVIIFYWLVHYVFNWGLDRIPLVPKLTKPFEKIIEIDVRGTATPDTDEEIIEIDVRGSSGVPYSNEISLPPPFSMLLGTGVPLPMLLGETTIIMQGFDITF